MFPYPADKIRSTLGYHPDPADLADVVDLVDGTHLLVVSHAVPDVRECVAQLRKADPDGVPLPTGLYWFGSPHRVGILAVPDGLPPGSGDICAVDEVGDDHPLRWAHAWYDHLWPDATAVPLPRFDLHDDVVVRSTGRDYQVRGRRFSGTEWVYEVRADGRTSRYPESMLDALEIGDDPLAWVNGPRDDARRFGATLTRAKLSGAFTDTVFSFRATRTLFRAYQFKPVIRMLESGKSRILIADEVGLGKTIEAGLIWTELEARAAADRVLVVCPASLVAKWRREMEERFGFQLTELSGASLSEFEARARENRLPTRFAHVMSIERLRTWAGLEDVIGIGEPLSLAIVDEAHVMRNAATRNFAVGSLLSEWAEALILLTATPINLRNQDLFNLLDLLTPGEFPEGETLELQLEPNVVLNRLTRLLGDPAASRADRLRLLDQLERLAFGGPVLARPEMELLRTLVARDRLDAGDVVQAKRYIADLNVLSSVLTRTRRVEVDEQKPVRETLDVEVAWSDREQEFYDLYVGWCEERARLAGVPVGFGMQMPLRLASACLPAARQAVLNWNQPSDSDESVDDESVSDADAATRRQPPLLSPSPQLALAADALGDTDSKYPLLEERLLRLIAEGRRALVFSFSRPALHYLAGRLRRRCRVAVLHGGVPKQRRHEVMADFRDGQYDVLLANRVASEGLDFEFCSVVVNYDLPWNPMEVEQRIGRIDRIGQQEDKVIVLNLWSPAALDDDMKRRLLQRIGVFEGTIGALEPIISAHLSDLREAVFDFRLTAEERRAKADRTLAAIEAQRAGLEDLATATPFLLAADDSAIAGMEEAVLARGRYVGPHELRFLIEDWAALTGAPIPSVTDTGRTLRLRGNATMASHLDKLVRAGRFRASEVDSYRTALVGENEIYLALDHELARTSRTADLLSARHPLVLASTVVPEQRAARFASLRAGDPQGAVPEGMYVVLLATAQWGSVRPGQELWGTGVAMDGRSAPEPVVDLLLSALARGTLLDGASWIPDGMDGLVDRAMSLMDHRLSAEAERREREARALLARRRLILQDQHDRRLVALEKRLETSRSSGNRGVRLFSAQIERARDALARTLASLDQVGNPDLSTTYLAICLLEVRHDC